MLLTVVGLLVWVAGCPSVTETPLTVVSQVDVSRYVGKWYEIASYPAVFQAGCTGTTAEYTLRDDGRVGVLNTCYQGQLDGPVKTIQGTARVVDTETNAKLKVTFFSPFEGDYWIIDLDEHYQWAVVGEPRRKFLWILSRTPTLDDAIYQSILARLPEAGYDASRLRRTLQVSQ
jgi:apolipoprotein D and lipocalin family protein